MSKFNDIMQEMDSIIKKSILPFDLDHAKRTLGWLLKLEPNADEILKISAFGHDIERAITGITETYSLKNLDNLPQFKQEHARRSAEIIKQLMLKNKYSVNEADRAYQIVKMHEVGGTADSDILMEADSLAFFGHIESYFEKNGPDKARDKFKFMVSRLSPKGLKVVESLQIPNTQIQQILDEVISGLKK